MVPKDNQSLATSIYFSTSIYVSRFTPHPSHQLRVGGAPLRAAALSKPIHQAPSEPWIARDDVDIAILNWHLVIQ